MPESQALRLALIIGWCFIAREAENAAEVWDIRRRQVILEIDAPDIVRSATFSKDARTLLIGMSGGVIEDVDAGICDPSQLFWRYEFPNHGYCRRAR